MDKSNLIVNYLPPSADEHELHALFSPCGPIQSVKVVRDRGTGISMGFGFVNFETNDAAAEAVRGLNGSDLHGKKIKVSIARPAWKANIHSNLYIANLPTYYEEQDVLTLLGGPYAQKIEHMRMLRDSRSNCSPGDMAFRGIVVVRFDTEETALQVLHQFNGTLVPETGMPLIVKPWRPEFRAERGPGPVAGQRYGGMDYGQAAKPTLVPPQNSLYPTSGQLDQFQPPQVHLSNGYPTPSADPVFNPFAAQQGLGPEEILRRPPMNLFSPSGLGMQAQPSQVPSVAELRRGPDRITGFLPNTPEHCGWAPPKPGPMTDSLLNELFAHYGDLENFQIMPGGTWGYINFGKRSQAQSAYIALNGRKVGDSFLKIIVRSDKIPLPQPVPPQVAAEATAMQEAYTSGKVQTESTELTPENEAHAAGPSSSPVDATEAAKISA